MRFPSPPGTRFLSALLLGALAACGGGGGGGGPAISIGFVANAGATTEGAAPIAVEVVLHTSLPALTAPVSVDVVDLGTGTATSGSDYPAFAPATVTFPIGAIDGDVQSVPLGATADLLVEGATETVRLGFAGASGTGLGALRIFTASVADADEATILFESAAGTTPDESAATTMVTVELDLAAGVSLGVVATARVADAHSGSATVGADYASFPSQAVTFGAGSVDGATQTVGVQVLSDTAIEADETVALALSAPSPGTVLGATSTFLLSIADDDATGPPALVATEGPTGVENTVAYDQLLELGTQTVDAGPNAGTRVRIQNAGGSAMALGAPELSGTNPNDFAVEVEVAPMPPPRDCADDGQREELDSPFLGASGLAAGDARAGVPIALDPAKLADLLPRTRVALRSVPAPGFPGLTFDLDRLPLPIAEDAVLAVDGAAIPGGLRAVLGDLSLWVGSAREIEGSRVFLALASEGSRGFLELPYEDNHLVHYATGSDLAGFAVDDRDLAALGVDHRDVMCAGALEAPGAVMQSLVSPEPGSRTETLTAADCRMAVETDYQLFQKFGSTGALTAYVTSLFGAVSDQYFTDVQTTLSIAYLGVYTSAADPWTSQDSGGNSQALLNEFVDAWTPNNWPPIPGGANLAHFVSGANLGGGIAYLNVICNQNSGFGVSGNINGTINWGTWTGAPGNFTWDFVVVAHEIGHNFGSNHTHSYCPPLDVCYTNCTGSTSCSQGTIMSYCHTCGGMDNIDLVFHPNCANIMRQKRGLLVPRTVGPSGRRLRAVPRAVQPLDRHRIEERGPDLRARRDEHDAAVQDSAARNRPVARAAKFPPIPSAG